MPMSNNIPIFVCGSMKYIDRPRFVIDYIYERCAQGSYNFSIIAPEIIPDPDLDNYDSNIEYENNVAYFNEAYIEGFVTRLRIRLLENEKYYVQYTTIEELTRIPYTIYVCTKKSNKFISRIVIMDYHTEGNLNKYEKQYLEQIYQRIEI